MPHDCTTRRTLRILDSGRESLQLGVLLQFNGILFAAPFQQNNMLSVIVKALPAIGSPAMQTCQVCKLSLPQHMMISCAQHTMVLDPREVVQGSHHCYWCF